MRFPDDMTCQEVSVAPILRQSDWTWACSLKEWGEHGSIQSKAAWCLTSITNHHVD